MSTEKIEQVEKEETSTPAAEATTTKPVSSGDYESRWKTIVQALAEADGDEFTKENDEEKGAGGDAAEASDSSKDKKPAAGVGNGQENADDAAAAAAAAADEGAAAAAGEEEIVVRKFNPEDDELNRFNMPSAATFLTDMSRYRHQKKVYVHPLKQEDLYHDTVVKLTTSEQCLEYRVHFYRDNTEQRAPQGLLTLFFSSNEAMTDAIEQLQKIREDLIVETHEAKNQKKLMPLWNRKSKEATGTALKNSVLCICNVPAKTTVDTLKKHFPTAKDIVIPICYEKGSKMKNKYGYAYAVFDTAEEADAVAKQYEIERPVVSNSTLGVYKYKEGTRKPNGLLSLTQRKLVLKHGAKAAAAIEKINNGEEVKSQELIKNKLKRCVELIERDNEVRHNHGLTTPSYERLTRMKNLPELDSKETQKLLAELRVIPATSGRRGYHTAVGAAGTSTSGAKKQQKRLARKGLRPRPRTGGLLGNMPGYMMSQMAALGYGYGYPHHHYGSYDLFGGSNRGSSGRYHSGYGSSGYGGGYYGGGGYAGQKGSQASGNVRPLLDTPPTVQRDVYNHGRVGAGYQQQQQQQQQGGGSRRTLLNQPNNLTGGPGQRGTGLNNGYNGYNNNTTNNRDGRGMYDHQYGGGNNSGSAAGAGDSWWTAAAAAVGGGYNNAPYNF